jgi:hypothetical protein
MFYFSALEPCPPFALSLVLICTRLHIFMAGTYEIKQLLVEKNLLFYIS